MIAARLPIMILRRRTAGSVCGLRISRAGSSVRLLKRLRPLVVLSLRGGGGTPPVPVGVLVSGLVVVRFLAVMFL